MNGKVKPMEREEMAMDEPDSMAIQVSVEQRVHASASGTAGGGQSPIGVGAPILLRASVHGDGQHWPPDSTRSHVAT